MYFLAISLFSSTLLTFAYILSCLHSFRKNEQIASQIGLPVVRVPFFEPSLVTSGIVRTPFFSILVDKLLPAALTKWVPYCRPDWRIKGKFALHHELGDLFLIVSPGGVILNVGDAEVARAILGSRSSFPKYAPVLAPVQMFGRNIFGAEGREWRLHRKLLSPPFNKENYGLVWEESIRQTTELLKIWQRHASYAKSFAIPDIRDGLKAITTKVISYAGFGVRLEFDLEENGEDEIILHRGSKMFTYGRAMEAATDDFRITLLSIIIPHWLLKFFPRVFFNAGMAYREFGEYLQNLLQLAETSSDNKSNLLTAVVKNEKSEMAAGASGFLQEERIGNTFAFSLAGQETLSVSLHNALTLLALNQGQQKWFLERLDQELEGKPEDPRLWEHEMFDSLSSGLCVLNETLRMRPVIPTLIRTTGNVTESLSYRGARYTLPRDTTIALSFYGLHYNEKYWGPDAEDFKPERWLSNSKRNLHFGNNERNDGGGKQRWKGIRIPVQGSFGPFSDGPRGCLGRVFAEVEMVAVLATLFQKYRVDLEVGPGETYEQARERAIKIIEDSSNQLTCSMRMPVGLQWERRLV